MIKSNPDRYDYMSAPNKLRDFMAKTQWDFNRRQWVGKTVDSDGYITIRPDTYSPAMCLELLRYALSIDANEQRAAFDAGLDKPRFELVPIEALIAIDVTWSLQGWHKPFQAVMEYIDIIENGQRYVIPEIKTIERQPMPKARFIQITNEDRNVLDAFSGLRNPLLEIFEDSHCMGTKQTKKGKIVMDVELESSFTVDAESAYLALDFERDKMIQIHNACDGKGFTQGYRWWVALGTISLSPQQVSIHDDILKRTRIKEELGLAGPNINKDDLLAISSETKMVTAKVEQVIPSFYIKPVQLSLFVA